MNNVFKDDFYRLEGKQYTAKSFIFSFLTEHRIRFVYVLRKMQMINSKRLFTRSLLMVYHRMLKTKYGLEINPSVYIGNGLQISHPYNITINNDAILGNNVNLNKGATIGGENRGKRCGAPTIGNNVFVGINSTIVGNIKIGNDVLIAPNSFVNRDVPDHSIVIGNPCKIVYNDNATHGYVNFCVENDSEI